MKHVLVSVSDKTGIREFITRLQKFSYTCIASGGTASALRDAGLCVRDAADYTGSPEILGGRVKTLHPAIHGGILSRPNDADKAELARLGLSEIDIVVVNLYPFMQTLRSSSASHDECVENIDIGGVALLRAAAKNYSRVTVVCDPADYECVASQIEATGETSAALRKKLAVKAFALCAEYDAAIASWLDPEICAQGPLLFGFESVPLRYGENPHQSARYYSHSCGGGALGGEALQGKDLSYNNMLDCDAAWRAVSLFEGNAAVVVKHVSPCGIAETRGQACARALQAAIACDPVSAYGGIIAVNAPFDGDCASLLDTLFVECVIAPEFTDAARSMLEKKKKLRLITAPRGARMMETRSVLGGFLRQEIDAGDPEGTDYAPVTKRIPTEAERGALLFAWRALVTVRSNAIVLARRIDSERPDSGYSTIGIGGGQPNRVDAVRHAIRNAEKYADGANGAVLASDAFFPFSDSIEEAAAAGIRAVIQPGGSIRDNDCIAACDAHGIAMLCTGVRHFRH